MPAACPFFIISYIKFLIAIDASGVSRSKPLGSFLHMGSSKMITVMITVLLSFRAAFLFVTDHAFRIIPLYYACVVLRN